MNNKIGLLILSITICLIFVVVYLYNYQALQLSTSSQRIGSEVATSTSKQKISDVSQELEKPIMDSKTFSLEKSPLFNCDYKKIYQTYQSFVQQSEVALILKRYTQKQVEQFPYGLIEMGYVDSYYLKPCGISVTFESETIFDSKSTKESGIPNAFTSDVDFLYELFPEKINDSYEKNVGNTQIQPVTTDSPNGSSGTWGRIYETEHDFQFRQIDFTTYRTQYPSSNSSLGECIENCWYRNEMTITFSDSIPKDDILLFSTLP